MRNFKLLLVILTTIVLAGCAGRHVRPAANYAQDLPTGTMRVAFDERGWMYPKDQSIVPWATYRLRPIGEAFGIYSLRLELMTDGNKNTPYTKERLKVREAQAITELNALLDDGDTLVVLIHGFNEDYEKATKTFNHFHGKLNSLPKKHKVLEVYWNGLIKNRLEPAGIGRILFWPNALANSNRAGDRGLRTLLNGVDKKIDLRFLTFSRGAAVALAALSQPLYDAGITRDGDTPKIGLDNHNIQSAKVGAFAPAVGDGHINAEFDQNLRINPIEVIAGVDARDFATSKWILPASFWGDTRLGSSPVYVASRMSQGWGKLKLTGVFFQSEEFHHNLETYLKNEAAADCIFSRLDLLSTPCSDELLIQPMTR